jgi:putative heme transporter
MAGVLLFSFFTYVCEIPGGALAYAWHQAARRWHRPPR